MNIKKKRNMFISDAVLTVFFNFSFSFHTVPSVAPANVSGGNGRRHELVISWEVGPLPKSLSSTSMAARVQKHKCHSGSGVSANSDFC